METVATPGSSDSGTGAGYGPLALRSVDRALAGRYSAYLDEVDRLMRAGVAVMRRSDTGNPRVGEIVAEAGLSNQAFYRHFRSKDELLLAILDDGLRQLVDYLGHQMAKEVTVTGKVRRWVEGIMAQAGNEDAAEATRGVVVNSTRLMERFPDECRAMEGVIEAPLVALLDKGLPPNRPRRDEGIEERVRAAYRLVMGSMEACLAARTAPTPSQVEHLVGFVLRGLGVDAEPSRTPTGRSI